MATWTAEKRRKLPLSSFGDPDRRLFPIEDQSDLDAAAKLLGRARNPDKVKKRLVVIARRLGLDLPDTWKEELAKMSDEDRTSNSVSCFDVDLSAFSIIDER